MRLIGRWRESVGPEGDVAGDAGQLGALLQAIAHAGRADHEIEGEAFAVGLDLDRGSVARDRAPLTIAVDTQPRFGAGALEGVSRRRRVPDIETPPDTPSGAVVKLAVMREEGGPLEPAMRVD